MNPILPRPPELAERLIAGFPGMAYCATPDADRRLLYASLGAREITGLDPDALAAPDGVYLGDLVHSDDRSELRAALQSAIEDEVDYSVRYRIKRDGPHPVWVWDRGRVVRGEGEEPDRLEGWIIDITEMVHMEARAITAQRKEALGQLIGAVAGEYNNLLTSVIGGIELALSEPPVDASVTAALQDGRAAALRGGALTQQLLAFARKQPSTPKVTEVNPLLHRMQDLLHQLLGREVRLLFTTGPDLPPVRVDPGQLEQVILNVALNARDAMPDGGRILIRTEQKRLTADNLRRGDELSTGPYAVIHISDSGVGVDPAIRSRMFEPFATTKSNASGLGLATAYGIVRQSGGMIRVRSEPGDGATFSIFLPAHTVSASLPQQHADPAAIPVVLVVDDDDAVRRTVVRTLQRSGFEAVEASDTPGALRTFNERKGAIDLLVTDVMMPGPSGAVLADQIQEALPGLPVVFISGHVAESETAALRLGKLRRFVSKPFTLSEILTAVRTALEDAAAETDYESVDASHENENTG